MLFAFLAGLTVQQVFLGVVVCLAVVVVVGGICQDLQLHRIRHYSGGTLIGDYLSRGFVGVGSNSIWFWDRKSRTRLTLCGDFIIERVTRAQADKLKAD